MALPTDTCVGRQRVDRLKSDCERSGVHSIAHLDLIGRALKFKLAIGLIGKSYQRRMTQIVTATPPYLASPAQIDRRRYGFICNQLRRGVRCRVVRVTCGVGVPHRANGKLPRSHTRPIADAWFPSPAIDPGTPERRRAGAIVVNRTCRAEMCRPGRSCRRGRRL